MLKVRWRETLLVPLCLSGVLLSTTISQAATNWSVSTIPTLLALPTESESDTSLLALCRNAGNIELHIGANEEVGRGRGESATLRFQSDGKSAVVKGVSRRSDNYEMTGGTELVTRVSSDSEFFKVLATGKPVNVSGSLKKSVTWSDTAIASAVTKFLLDCK